MALEELRTDIKKIAVMFEDGSAYVITSENIISGVLRHDVDLGSADSRDKPRHVWEIRFVEGEPDKLEQNPRIVAFLRTELETG